MYLRITHGGRKLSGNSYLSRSWIIFRPQSAGILIRQNPETLPPECLPTSESGQNRSPLNHIGPKSDPLRSLPAAWPAAFLVASALDFAEKHQEPHKTC